jgi:hypothetical protein
MSIIMQPNSPCRSVRQIIVWGSIGNSRKSQWNTDAWAAFENDYPLTEDPIPPHEEEQPSTMSYGQTTKNI